METARHSYHTSAATDRRLPCTLAQAVVAQQNDSEGEPMDKTGFVASNLNEEDSEDKISPGRFIEKKLVRTAGKVELLHRVLPKFFATVSPLILIPWYAY